MKWNNISVSSDGKHYAAVDAVGNAWFCDGKEWRALPPHPDDKGAAPVVERRKEEVVAASGTARDGDYGGDRLLTDKHAGHGDPAGYTTSIGKSAADDDKHKKHSK
jgi:hypothetical protein